MDRYFAEHPDDKLYRDTYYKDDHLGHIREKYTSITEEEHSRQ